MTRRLRLILLLGFVAIVIVTAAALVIVPVRNGLSAAEIIYLRVWLARYDRALNTPVAADATPLIFTVSPGDTAASVGQNLFAGGLIADPVLFRNYARYRGLDSQLEAGTYFLNRAQALPDIAQTLTDSSKASVTIRILEGWRREQIAEAIDTNPLLQFSGTEFLAITAAGASVPGAFAAYVGLPPGISLEGFLYPDTYTLSPTATAADLRDTLLATFQERAGPDLRTAAQAAGLSLFEAVTLASIVEREAVIRDEQPLIAGVYLNRLAIGMKLDADPTVQYGIGYRSGSWWPGITQADYATAVSPYNTYLHAGLPPGPIANPALPAIRAAIYPQESGYYYFRADCAASGLHVFAVTFEQHIANGNCP
jgi:UPF0755 protein